MACVELVDHGVDAPAGDKKGIDAAVVCRHAVGSYIISSEYEIYADLVIRKNKFKVIQTAPSSKILRPGAKVGAQACFAATPFGLLRTRIFEARYFGKA